MKTEKKALLFVVSLFLIASCNLYSPFNSTSTPNDFLEEALKCLHNGDFACAITNYEQLPDGDLKNQKLCTAYMAKAGLTLNTMLNVVTEQSTGMLGSLANAVIPWTAQKTTDAETARSYCNTFGASATSGENGVYLSSLGLMLDCAVRMAKTDQFVGASEADTSCSTVATKTGGRISQGDIEGSGTQVMCTADVTQCRNDFVAVQNNNAAIQQAGLSDLKGALDAVPAELKNAASTADQTRDALIQTLPVD